MAATVVSDAAIAQNTSCFLPHAIVGSAPIFPNAR